MQDNHPEVELAAGCFNPFDGRLSGVFASLAQLPAIKG